MLKNKPLGSICLVLTGEISPKVTKRWFSDSLRRIPEAAGPAKAPDGCWMKEHSHGWV